MLGSLPYRWVATSLLHSAVGQRLRRRELEAAGPRGSGGPELIQDSAPRDCTLCVSAAGVPRRRATFACLAPVRHCKHLCAAPRHDGRRRHRRRPSARHLHEDVPSWMEARCHEVSSAKVLPVAEPVVATDRCARPRSGGSDSRTAPRNSL